MQKTNFIIQHNLNRNGLGPAMLGTSICQEAEKLYPNLFEAVSLRNQVLHLRVHRQKLMEFKMIQGKLLEELNQYSQTRNYPEISRIRLTIEDETANIE